MDIIAKAVVEVGLDTKPFDTKLKQLETRVKTSTNLMSNNFNNLSRNINNGVMPLQKFVNLFDRLSGNNAALQGMVNKAKDLAFILGNIKISAELLKVFAGNAIGSALGSAVGTTFGAYGASGIGRIGRGVAGVGGYGGSKGKYTQGQLFDYALASQKQKLEELSYKMAPEKETYKYLKYLASNLGNIPKTTGPFGSKSGSVKNPFANMTMAGPATTAAFKSIGKFFVSFARFGAMFARFATAFGGPILLITAIVAFVYKIGKNFDIWKKSLSLLSDITKSIGYAIGEVIKAANRMLTVAADSVSAVIKAVANNKNKSFYEKMVEAYDQIYASRGAALSGKSGKMARYAKRIADFENSLNIMNLPKMESMNTGKTVNQSKDSYSNLKSKLQAYTNQVNSIDTILGSISEKYLKTGTQEEQKYKQEIVAKYKELKMANLSGINTTISEMKSLADSVFGELDTRKSYIKSQADLQKQMSELGKNTLPVKMSQSLVGVEELRGLATQSALDFEQSSIDLQTQIADENKKIAELTEQMVEMEKDEKDRRNRMYDTQDALRRALNLIEEEY